METTKISWTDATFNPWWGCTKVSPGCTHCYADTFAKRVGQDIWGPNAERRFFGAKHWVEPYKWDEKARKAGKRLRVFCASMADVFEDRADLDPERRKLWDLIETTPNIDWQLLTKRPQNICRMIDQRWMQDPRPNVWFGTTAENQEQANARIPELLKVPARIRFLSVEPMLGPVKLNEIPNTTKLGSGESRIDAIGGWAINTFKQHMRATPIERIHWVICGGESGAGARPMGIEWARDLRAQCDDAGVSFFMKQLGGVRDKRHKIDDMPNGLRVREFPIY